MHNTTLVITVVTFILLFILIIKKYIKQKKNYIEANKENDIVRQIHYATCVSMCLTNFHHIYGIDFYGKEFSFA